MKRPQRRSKTKAKSELVAADTMNQSELERMERDARYRSSSYHRFAALCSGPESTMVFRPDKTVCDMPASRKATDLLRLGFRRGMVSEQRRNGWPQNVWAVDADGIVYEAQLSNSGLGEYHGYPMKQGDSFAGFVGKEWEKRGA